MDRRIFINYRSDDSPSYGTLLYHQLAREFGEERVFLDCESIPAGADFVEELLSRVRSAEAVLAVIGPHWLNAVDGAGRRRIDDPDDWVRRELIEAFAAGVRVIPVLVEQVAIPAAGDLPADVAALSRCQFRRLRHHDSTADLTRIVTDLTGVAPRLTGANRAHVEADARQVPRLSVKGTETPEGFLRQTPPTIDVRLVNSGTGTAVITGCEVHVVWARRFPTPRPPVTKINTSGAATLKPSAHYMALLPGPEEADRVAFDSARDEPILPRDPEGLGPSHSLEPGEADRFIIRLEATPHGGGTLFDHAMPGDDQFVYIVRLTLTYVGGGPTREISTGEIAVGFPANVFAMPSPDEIERLVHKFRKEVERTQQDIDIAFLNAGVEPVDWRGLPGVLDDLERQAPMLSLRELDTVQKLLEDHPDLTDAFRRPERAVRDFVQRCEDFYRTVITTMYTEIEDTRRLRASATRHLAALERDPGRYRW